MTGTMAPQPRLWEETKLSGLVVSQRQISQDGRMSGNLQVGH